MTSSSLRWSVALFAMAGCRSPAPANGSHPLADAEAVPMTPTSSAPSPASTIDSAVPTPPAALACLVRHYIGRAIRDGEGWAMQLPDGTVPWDDGRTKSPAERIDGPDLEDMLVLGYPTGAITPIMDDGSDPGRIRVEPLFRAVYGATPRDVNAALVDVKLAGHTVKFHRRAAPALQRVSARIEALLRDDPSLARYFRTLGGSFNPRTIAGTDRQSAHSWGIAIDIDTSRSDYWQNHPKPVVWRNRIPQSVVDAFEAESFVWGGRWFHYDTMHFEWRPELFDAQCRVRTISR